MLIVVSFVVVLAVFAVVDWWRRVGCAHDRCVVGGPGIVSVCKAYFASNVVLLMGQQCSIVLERRLAS